MGENSEEDIRDEPTPEDLGIDMEVEDEPKKKVKNFIDETNVKNAVEGGVCVVFIRSLCGHSILRSWILRLCKVRTNRQKVCLQGSKQVKTEETSGEIRKNRKTLTTQ